MSYNEHEVLLNHLIRWLLIRFFDAVSDQLVVLYSNEQHSIQMLSTAAVQLTEKDWISERSEMSNDHTFQKTDQGPDRTCTERSFGDVTPQKSTK